MTFGDKLAHLRKSNNYTQEQLADILDVSRQSISKWESNLAYPETGKLIAIGRLFDCSMDYLLVNDDEQMQDDILSHNVETPLQQSHRFDIASMYYEKKSSATINGIPLWHINIGRGRRAKGIIAIGNYAQGIIAIGLISFGMLSFGVLSLGLISLGALAIGLFSGGAIAVGIVATGAVAVGVLAVGALSVGQFSIGAAALGKYLAIGDASYADIAIGKTTAIGSILQASSINDGNRDLIISSLHDITPAVLRPLLNIILSFV